MRTSIHYHNVTAVELVHDDDPDSFKKPVIEVREKGHSNELTIFFDDCDDLLGFIDELQKNLSVCLAKRGHKVCPAHKTPLASDGSCGQCQYDLNPAF